jgi:hypothetical protein
MTRVENPSPMCGIPVVTSFTISILILWPSSEMGIKRSITDISRQTSSCYSPACDSVDLPRTPDHTHPTSYPDLYTMTKTTRGSISSVLDELDHVKPSAGSFATRWNLPADDDSEDGKEAPCTVASPQTASVDSSKTLTANTNLAHTADPQSSISQR